MQTKEQLQALSAKQLNTRLDELSEKTGEKLPKSGSNEDKVERILTAQERLALDKPDDSDSADQSDSSNDSLVTPETTELKAQTVTGYRISAVAESGFFRCGKFFPHEGRDIAADQLSDNELATLRAEKNLTVEALSA